MYVKRSFTIYLTDEDKEKLDMLAHCAGLSKTEFIRKLIHDAYKSRKKIDEK